MFGFWAPSLLDQTIARRGYDSALVSALAVLGIGDGGWKTPEAYPQVLLHHDQDRLVMVVRNALELSGPDDGESHFNDNRRTILPTADRKPDVGNQSRSGRGQKWCLQLVVEMMDRFMVRVSQSQSQMQRMLDLRNVSIKDPLQYNGGRPH